MNEQDFARKVVANLDQGLVRIKEGTLYRLQSARNNALNHYREPSAPIAGLVWAGEVAFRLGHSRYLNGRNAMAAALLVLSLIGVSYWRVQTSDIADIDAGLLACELPINAYLDNDFDAWLKRSSR
jgi:hypothetical protein